MMTNWLTEAFCTFGTAYLVVHMAHSISWMIGTLTHGPDDTDTRNPAPWDSGAGLPTDSGAGAKTHRP